MTEADSPIDCIHSEDFPGIERSFYPDEKQSRINLKGPLVLIFKGCGFQVKKSKGEGSSQCQEAFFFGNCVIQGGRLLLFAHFSLLCIDVWTRQQYKQAMCDSEQLHGKWLLVLVTAYMCPCLRG